MLSVLYSVSFTVEALVDDIVIFRLPPFSTFYSKRIISTSRLNPLPALGQHFATSHGPKINSDDETPFC